MKIYSRFCIVDKIAIVIGGSGQLGSKTVDVLLDAGCKVINLDLLNNRNLVSKKKQNYFYFKLDISKENNVKKISSIIKKKFKKIDILINHSHYKGDKKKLTPFHNFFASIENYSSKIWEKTMKVNINGLFFCTKYFLPLLIKNKKSVILNTSSTYGKVSPNKKIYGNSGINSPISYATTKFAIIGFTKYIACHYAHKGLRANVIIPGGIENKNQSKEFLKKYSELTPIKRLSESHEYKEAILYLVSDASSYVTGSEMVIDGGYTAW
jgi:NAD(P)-dependent dehydrogenase (short-subunit alcohol dehydrogenase family)